MDPEMEESDGGRCDSPVCPCPSFNTYSSGRLAEVVSGLCREEEEEEEEELGSNLELASADFSGRDREDRPDRGGNQDDGEEDDDFEFVSLVKNPDEVFIGSRYDGPVYPVFNRDLLSVGRGSETGSGEEEDGRSMTIPLKNLFLEDRDPPSCSSSEADELEGVPEGLYCIWTPRSPAVEQSPARCKKSNSTGSCSKRWRFRDLLRRSNSDGKDSFVFLTPSSSSTTKDAGSEGSKEKRNFTGEAKVPSKTGSNRAAKEKVKTPAHETLYVRNKAQKEGDRRRSYLPYRKDLVGFFANVNSFGRSFPPF